jgi:twitching motility protein PilT
MPLEALLRRMVDTHASDLHLKSGSPPGYRVNGDIVPHADHPILTKHETRAFVEEVLNPEQLKAFDESGDYDLSKAIPGLARFRVNCNRQRAACGLVIRIIPEQVPQLEQLATPPIFKKLCELPRGLVLVTGPTGSGKSTTLAAMIDHINRTEAGHILTMEDPIEFVHVDRKSFVNQREVGLDTANFSEALRRALRQDPDVILVGEMRDLETISLAITAAETGHLVFGTLHTTSAIQTVDRIIDVFPHEAQQQVRMQLSMALAGVISQTLVPKVSGGRVAIHEILIGTDGVRACIREGKTHMLLNMLQTGTKDGMQTLEQGMAEGVKKGLITFDAGIMRVNNPNFFRTLLTGHEAAEGAGKGGNAAHAAAGSAHGAPAHSAPHAAPPHAAPPHAVPPHAVPPHAAPPHAVPQQPPPAVPGAAPASPPPPRAPARSFPQPPVPTLAPPRPATSLPTPGPLPHATPGRIGPAGPAPLGPVPGNTRVDDFEEFRRSLTQPRAK